ncbi:MAG: hypothetical protein Hens3KO_00010 [Henriciella sp.]
MYDIVTQSRIACALTSLTVLSGCISPHSGTLGSLEEQTSFASLAINTNEDVAQSPNYQSVSEFEVPDTHEIGDQLIAFEGPGWESDKVGYRLYLDSRNAIDVFGKRIAKPALQRIVKPGQHHELDDWGMDVLKVGESVGVGGLAFWIDGEKQIFGDTDSLRAEVVSNGPQTASVRVTHTGFAPGLMVEKVSALYTIRKGQRHFEVNVSELPENAPMLVTGIGRQDVSVLKFKRPENAAWGYVAGYINESLSGHPLGVATFVPSEQFASFQLDQDEALILLSQSQNQTRYVSTAAWAAEPNGISSAAEFMNYVEELSQSLAQEASIATRSSGD